MLDSLCKENLKTKLKGLDLALNEQLNFFKTIRCQN